MKGGGKKTYGVSNLNGPSSSPPLKVEFRPRQEDIDVFIPSVQLAMGGMDKGGNDTPRTADSNQSALTSSTLASGYVIAAGRADAGGTATGSRPAKSLNLPIKILKSKSGRNGNLMAVEVSAASGSLESPSGSTLSILESRLPSEMQGYRKKVAAELLSKLRESLALSAYNAKTQHLSGYRKMHSDMDDEDLDDYTIGSDPKHYSSGSSLAIFPSRNFDRRLLHGATSYSQNSLWAGPDSSSSMEYQERLQEMRKTRGSMSASDGINFLSKDGADKISDPSDPFRPIGEVDDQDNHSIGLIQYAGSHDAHQLSPDPGQSPFRASGQNWHLGLGGIETQSESLYSTTSTNDLPQEIGEFTTSQSILSLGDRGGVPPNRKIEEEDSPALDNDKFEQTDQEGQNEQETISLQFAQKSIPPQPIDIPDIELISLTRQKLQQLGKYVLGHTYRKIIVSWNIIDSRFQKSHQTKTEMVRDELTGISTPQKLVALPLSTLVTVVCSNQVRVVHNELIALAAHLGCTVEDLDRARKIAAIRTCLGPDQGKGLNPRSVEILMADLKALTDDHVNGPEKLVSLWRLKNLVFPQDPLEREVMIRQMEEERSLWIRQQVEEKKRREELKGRVEARRKKLIIDYEDSLRNIQFPKGPLKPEKVQALKELIAYCKKSFEVAHLTQDITVTDESLSLLGIEAFPNFVQDSIGNKTTHGSKVKSMNETSPQASSTADPIVGVMPQAQTRLGYEGNFRIRLQGDPPTKGKKSGPTVLFLIKETVSYGKGLNGLAYRDVVEMLQAYSSTRIGARFRCHSRWWKYKVARKMWRKIFLDVKLRFLRAWALYVRHVEDTRNFCWRKLKAWRFYTRRAILRREHFRINFWPFYVWHRWAASRRTATEKAQFLVFRVLPTYILMKHYRAWKRYFVKEKSDRTKADRYVMNWKWRRAKKLLRWYRRWTRRRVTLRHHWYKGGVHMHREKVRLCKMTPFLIWKSYWFYKKQVQARSKSLAFPFRSALLPFVPPVKPFSNSERRQRFRAKSASIDNKDDADDGAAHSDDEEKEGEQGKDSKMGGKKGKRSKASKKGKKDKSKTSDSSKDIVEEAPTKAKKIFTWKLTKQMDPIRGFDVPSDGEDEVRSSLVNSGYSDAITPLPLGPELEFLELADDYIRNKVAVMSTRFLVVDKLALIESGMRYHRSMSRAFTNLRIFAQISRNSRISYKKISNHRKRQSFMALLTWMLRDPNGGLNLDDQTDAEQVYFAAKSYRMDKMMKWRDAAITIKQVYGRDYDDVDISAPSKPGVLTTTKKRRKPDKEKAELILPDGTPYVPPNFLEWDRQDRTIETEQAERMVIVSRELVKTVHEITAKAQVESEVYDAAVASLIRTVDEVLETEDNITQAAIEAEMMYISQFKRHAAENLLNVLCKVSREVDVLLMRRELKKYFRSLRMPMIIKRGTALYNFKKLANWIRICKRLMCISQNAPLYHRSRTLWVCYNRWLKLIEKESFDASPGLVRELARRKEFLPKFSQELVAAGFKRMPYVSNKRLYAAVSTKKAIFYRWVQETQENKLFALMADRAGVLANWRLIQKCFFSLRTSMRVEDTFEMRRASKPFVLVRADADLDQLRKRFIAVRKRSFALAIISMNRRTVHYQIKDAKKTPSFKKFLLGFRSEVERRLVREQRILLDAFDARGTQEFIDLPYPDQRDAMMPSLMTRIDAPRFIDPHPAITDADLARMAAEEDESEDRWDIDRQPSLPGGFKICKIRINHSIDMGQAGGIQGIVGWQIVWAADGSEDVEGPKRGRWKGASMKVHELTIPKEDFVVGIEYLYEGITILGLRAKLHYAGFSRWLGDKPTMSTLSVYLSPDLAPRQSFEDDYKSPGKEEDESPAMPRTFVIGLSGLEVQGRVSSLTLVVRKIKSQHIFSYFWVNDALAARSLGSELVAGFGGQVDVNSLPAQLNVDAPEFDPRLLDGESLTNATRYGNREMHDQSNANKLPPISGAVAETNSQQGDDSSVGDMSGMSSISHGSKGLHRHGHDSPKHQGSHAKDQGSPNAELHPQVRSLTSSEEQFFDVFRMRLMEITTAQKRAEELARKLWTARQVRDNPVLSKLTSLSVIAPLTKWFFQAICKRVVKALPTEAQGELILEQAKRNLREADRLWRRSINETKIAREFESIPQSWQAKLLALAPAERAIKKVWTEEVKALKSKAASTKQQSLSLRADADHKIKLGRQMLPRMCLSTYICNMFSLKISAARHKEMLLQSGMDLEAMKMALRGAGGKLAELSDVGMEMIRFSLANKKPHFTDPLALDKLVEAEVKRMRDRAQSGQQTLSNELSVVSSTGRLHATIPATTSAGAERQHEGEDQIRGGAKLRLSASTPALTLPPTFLPVVTDRRSGKATDSDSISSSGYPPANRTARRSSGINIPHEYSSTPSLFKMTRSVGHNARRAAALKGSSSTTALTLTVATKQQQM